MKGDLQAFANYPIDWNLTPEHAVTMYLEWGNNDWNSEHGPVRLKSDTSIYFVVDTWEAAPIIRLVRRNTEKAEDLIAFPLKDELLPAFREEFGSLKGIFAPTEEIKAWLRKEMDLD